MIVYDLIVRGLNCNKCKSGHIWCIEGDFMRPSDFRLSDRTAYGYALSSSKVVSLKKSALTYIWTDAKSYCTKCNNAGKYGYCPGRRELASLYNSIMKGNMKKDLIEAGLYEECDYREASINEWDCGWGWIWSSSKYKYDPFHAYSVGYDKCVDSDPKSNNNYVIPFFKF